MDLSMIGKQIKAAREAAQITQEELAEAVGCTAKHIGAIERGIKTPRLDTFILIANTTGVSADYLLQLHLSPKRRSCHNGYLSARRSATFSNAARSSVESCFARSFSLQIA